MGSFIELNDTLQITTEQGFPSDILNLDNEKINFEDLENKVFEFKEKEKARIYHPAPTRCFLVHNIDGKWLYWGKIVIIEQTIKGEEEKNTSGKFKIIQLYDKDYQKQITVNESPKGLSYF